MESMGLIMHSLPFTKLTIVSLGRITRGVNGKFNCNTVNFEKTQYNMVLHFFRLFTYPLPMVGR